MTLEERIEKFNSVVSGCTVNFYDPNPYGSHVQILGIPKRNIVMIEAALECAVVQRNGFDCINTTVYFTGPRSNGAYIDVALLNSDIDYDIDSLDIKIVKDVVVPVDQVISIRLKNIGEQTLEKI